MGSFNYSGPSAAAALTVGALNECLDAANARMLVTDNYANQAVAAASVTPPSLDSLTVPSIDTAITPDTSAALRANLLSEMSADQTATLNELIGIYTTFLDTYFPWGDEFTAAQAWVNKALTTGGTGLSAAVEAQIWERDRARLQGEANRAEEEALTMWAGRRFPLPPGAAAHQILQIRQKLTDGLSQASRDVAIKQAEMELENVKFALTTTLDRRKESIAQALEYVKTLTFAYTFPSEQVVQSAQSTASLQQAATAYYEAQVGLKDLVLKNAMNTYDVQARFVETKANIQLQYVRQEVDALVAAMHSVGVQAAAALNGIHGSVGYSGDDASN